MLQESTILGCVLLLAGILKAADFGRLQSVLSHYCLLPEPLRVSFLALLVGSEILLAVVILSGFRFGRFLAFCESGVCVSILIAAAYVGDKASWVLLGLVVALFLSRHRSRCRPPSDRSIY
ncbi:hypothetical protein JST97_25040 [bacterium]|nr:hypothetical protein [bacterium]